MEQFVYPVLTLFFGSLITWLFSKRKTNAEAKSAEIEAEVKAANFYKSLLDDAMYRLEKAIVTINNQERKIIELIEEIEHLTGEIRKYKQLNGKAE